MFEWSRSRRLPSLGTATLLILSLQSHRVCPVRHLERSCGQLGTRQSSAGILGSPGMCQAGVQHPLPVEAAPARGWLGFLQLSAVLDKPRASPGCSRKPRCNTLEEGILDTQVLLALKSFLLLPNLCCSSLERSGAAGSHQMSPKGHAGVAPWGCARSCCSSKL